MGRGFYSGLPRPGGKFFLPKWKGLLGLMAAVKKYECLLQVDSATIDSYDFKKC
jgi:hypothetical protein